MGWKGCRKDNARPSHVLLSSLACRTAAQLTRVLLHLPQPRPEVRLDDPPQPVPLQRQRLVGHVTRWMTLQPVDLCLLKVISQFNLQLQFSLASFVHFDAAGMKSMAMHRCKSFEMHRRPEPPSRLPTCLSSFSRTLSTSSPW